MKIIASWDDGSMYDLRLAELMNKYNISSIFYWPSLMEKSKAKAKLYLNEKECKEIASKFEIGSHSMSHSELSGLTINQLGNEITSSKKHWQDLTGQEINSFAYPKNSINNLVLALIKGAGYKNARTSTTGFLVCGEPFKTTCTVQIGVDRVDYKGISWELFAEKMLNQITETSVFHLFGNSWEIEKNKDWDNLENLIKKLILS